MNYIRLGSTGMKVSRICLGCMTYGDPQRGAHSWTLPEADSRPLIRQALDLGVNFFDTSNSYSDGSSEEILGRALRDFAPREETILATKCFFPVPLGAKVPNNGGLSRKAILQAVDASLKRLSTDYIDLYQIHRWDYATPIEETLEALHDLIKAGKVRYIGASSMFAWQFAKSRYIAQNRGWTPFATMQNHYNLLNREEEREMLPFCVDQAVGVLPWSPLARGRLTRDWDTPNARTQTDQVGKTLYSATEEADHAVASAVAAVAQRRGLPRAQVALAWLLSKPVVTAPIVGASKAAHLTDAVAALDVTLTGEEIAEMEAPYIPHRIVGFT